MKITTIVVLAVLALAQKSFAHSDSILGMETMAPPMGWQPSSEDKLEQETLLKAAVMKELTGKNVGMVFRTVNVDTRPEQLAQGQKRHWDVQTESHRCAGSVYANGSQGYDTRDNYICVEK